ncbi:MAG: hypothetical protein ACRCXT_09490 [Paraclostridium sp.]
MDIKTIKRQLYLHNIDIIHSDIESNNTYSKKYNIVSDGDIHENEHNYIVTNSKMTCIIIKRIKTIILHANINEENIDEHIIGKILNSIA